MSDRISPTPSNPSPPASEGATSTIVLQPKGALNRATSSEFQQTLDATLAQVTETVIVDLLWVDSTDMAGVAVLLHGMQRAADLGKTLSFQSMDIATRSALEAELTRQREQSIGPWSDRFGEDLEQFLDSLIRH